MSAGCIVAFVFFIIFGVVLGTLAIVNRLMGRRDEKAVAHRWQTGIRLPPRFAQNDYSDGRMNACILTVHLLRADLADTKRKLERSRARHKKASLMIRDLLLRAAEDVEPTVTTERRKGERRSGVANRRKMDTWSDERRCREGRRQSKPYFPDYLNGRRSGEDRRKS